MRLTTVKLPTNLSDSKRLVLMSAAVTTNKIQNKSQTCVLVWGPSTFTHKCLFRFWSTYTYYKQPVNSFALLNVTGKKIILKIHRTQNGRRNKYLNQRNRLGSNIGVLFFFCFFRWIREGYILRVLSRLWYRKDWIIWDHVISCLVGVLSLSLVYLCKL